MDRGPIPERDDYYMQLAHAVAARSNCMRRVVGAVVVVEDRVVATGYNGTPSGMTNCLDGGCVRCARHDIWELGTAYDLCICVHAEANCIATERRRGVNPPARSAADSPPLRRACSRR
jgi:dCMP deaminase